MANEFGFKHAASLGAYKVYKNSRHFRDDNSFASIARQYEDRQIAARSTQVIFPTASTDSKHKSLKEQSVEIAKRLVEKYTQIVIDGELCEPRLAGTRFAVANVLTAIGFYADLSEVIEEYDGQYSKEQIIEAINFARDFLNAHYRYESHSG